MGSSSFKKYGLFILTYMILTAMNGCDSSVSPPSEMETGQPADVEFIPMELTDESRTDAGDPKFKKPKSPYACLISTLQKPGFGASYEYKGYWLRFSRPAVREARGKTTYEIFLMGSEDAGPHAESIGGLEKIVRMARCEIPDSPRARKLLKKHFRRFGKGSWLESLQGPEQEKDDTENSGSETSGWECKQWFIVIACSKEAGCTINEVRCTGGWTYIPDGSSEGGSSGGSSSDPCSNPDLGGTQVDCEYGGGGGSFVPPGNPSLPCPGDPAPSPEIAPTENQGIAGGRYGAPRRDGTPHRGLDIKADINSPVYSMFSGRVYSARSSFGDFGNYVIVESNLDGENIFVLYAHLNSLE